MTLQISCFIRRAILDPSRKKTLDATSNLSIREDVTTHVF